MKRHLRDIPLPCEVYFTCPTMLKTCIAVYVGAWVSLEERGDMDVKGVVL